MTFTLANPNASPLTGVAFTDNLPGVGTAGGGIVLGTPVNLNPALSPCGGTVNSMAGGATLSFTGGVIAANGTCSFSVSVFAFRAGTVSNATTGPTSNEAPAGAPASAVLTITEPLVKGINPNTVPPVTPPVLTMAFTGANTNPFLPLNTPTPLTFTIKNNNANFALTGMGFTDTLPDGMVVSSPNGLVSSCAGAVVTAVPGSNLITVSGASLASVSSCTITVNVQGPTAGNFTNQTSQITSVEGGSAAGAIATIAVGTPLKKGL